MVKRIHDLMDRKVCDIECTFTSIYPKTHEISPTFRLSAVWSISTNYDVLKSMGSKTSCSHYWLTQRMELPICITHTSFQVWWSPRKRLAQFLEYHYWRNNVTNHVQPYSSMMLPFIIVNFTTCSLSARRARGGGCASFPRPIGGDGSRNRGDSDVRSRCFLKNLKFHP